MTIRRKFVLVLTVPILAAESVPGRSWGRMFTDLLKQAVFLA